jgi:uncharacterized membrane protein
MDSRLRVSGQAIQPVLVMFPLGLFAMAVLFDLAVLLGAPAIVGQLGYWNVVAGLLGGVFATLAGAIDVMLARTARTKRIGVLQTLMNMGVLILFTVILMLRMRTPDRVTGGGLFVVELLALGAAVYAAWSGGELVNRRTIPVLIPVRPASVPERPPAGRPSPRPAQR